ncbi:MAG: recombination regulator RecX [Thermodesulfovibrionales bacterium]|nr:recombination regulator RecX [Thermodesulfovibrionales bacterium]
MKDSEAKARAFALKLLGYRQRSESELRERLLGKGFSQEVTENIIKIFKNSGLIDDRDAAKYFVRVGEQRLLGKRKIAEILFKRGIKPELVEEVIEEFDETESATRSVQKWLRRHSLKDRDSEEKLKEFMLRRGYRMDTIIRIIKKIKEEGK